MASSELEGADWIVRVRHHVGDRIRVREYKADWHPVLDWYPRGLAISLAEVPAWTPGEGPRLRELELVVFIPWSRLICLEIRGDVRQIDSGGR